MKAEHRKELQTNALADALGNTLQRAKEGPSQQVLLVGGLALLVVALIVIFYYFSTHSKDGDAARWEQWNTMTQQTKFEGNPDELASLTKEYPGKSLDWVERLYEKNKFEAANANTPQARLVRFQKARLFLENSETVASLLSIQRDTTLKCIAKGRDLYEKLVNEAGDVSYLAEEALFNGAKANEDLGEYDRAKKLYERLKKEHPKSVYAPSVEKALTRLSDQNDLDKLKAFAEAR